MRKLTLLTLCCLITPLLFAQQSKTWNASFLDAQPSIDGVLKDSCWQGLEPLSGFITATPVFGKTPNEQTSVRLFYNARALYVAVFCSDPDTMGIREDKGVRDEELTGDWFQLSLDTWDDDQLAFDFTVSAAGVQRDSRQGRFNWDARWQSAVVRQVNGWSLEIRIPFTALRFPRKDRQQWGLQLTRFDRSTGEKSTWSPERPLVGDRVLQFGTLKGIRDVRQMKRRQLAVHSKTALNLRKDAFKENTLDQSLGVDGRIGLTEQATLDFTVLPPLSLHLDWFNDLGLTTSLITSSVISEPRQFSAEESDMFERNNAFADVPVLSASQLNWRHPLEGFERYTNYVNSRLIQATKLTARTKGNLRFGALNAFLSPVKGDIESLLTPETRHVSFQGLSNYNFLTAEYLLPNNSFVHLSNAALLAGSDMRTLTPRLEFRLRNRANTLGTGGAFEAQLQRIDTSNQRAYRYNYSIGRINRQFGWQLEHYGYRQEPQPQSSLLIMPSLDRSSAQISFRTFKPGRVFLNKSASANVIIHWARTPEDRHEWFLSGAVSGMDRHFRLTTASLDVRPYTYLIRYENAGTYLNREIAPTVGGNFSFRTDTRRGYWYSLGLGGSVSTAGELPVLRARFRPAWVISRWARVSADFQFQGTFKQLTLLAAPGRWLFEQEDRWNAFGKLLFQWYPISRLGIRTSMQVFSLDAHNRKAVELEVGGKLVPVDWPLNTSYSYLDKSFTLGLQYIFAGINQIRFDYTLGSPNTIDILPALFSYNPAQYLRANLSLIWVLNASQTH